MRTSRILSGVSVSLCAGTVCLAFVRLTPPTLDAFDRYAARAEAGMDQSLHSGNFLYLDSQPQLKAKARSGEILIERRTTLDKGLPIRVPDGRIHDWMGAMFMPGATLTRVRAVMQDYANYKKIYQPDVIESRLKAHEGDEFDIFLRLYKKQIITVVFNADYHVVYGSVDPQHIFIVSRSTRIAEVKNPQGSATEEMPPGNDTGFLWRLNSYWRFEEADGGVYAQCEAISLSRDVPFGLGWMIGSFVEKFPRESMVNTLRATQKAVEGPGSKD